MAKHLAIANYVCVVGLYSSAHLIVSCGLGKHPFVHSHHSGELQHSSTVTLQNQPRQSVISSNAILGGIALPISVSACLDRRENWYSGGKL